MNTTYKIVICGAGGVGKTTYINHYLGNQFDSRYIATMGVEVHPLTFNTNQGHVKFNCWDLAGQERFGGLREGYFIGAQAFILFVDDNIAKTQVWYNLITQHSPNVPIVVCRSKCDLNGNNSGITFAQSHHLPCCSISSKNNTNINRPWGLLLRTFLGDNVELI